MVDTRLLERTAEEIRVREHRKPGESVLEWAFRTWSMVLEEYERLLGLRAETVPVTGKQEQEKENEE